MTSGGKVGNYREKTAYCTTCNIIRNGKWLRSANNTESKDAVLRRSFDGHIPFTHSEGTHSRVVRGANPYEPER